MAKLKPPYNFFASLRLAVFVILSLAAVSSVGTIMEARYDAEVAQKLVYQSVYMYAVMILLIINLIAVMIDRWPWKQQHTGFVMAHIGIITLLFGSYLTQEYGIDGTMAFEIGQKRQSIIVKDRELSVYSSMDGNRFTNIFKPTPVDFLRHPPTAEKPYIVRLSPTDILTFTQYENFSFRESEISASSADHDGPAVRFQLENPNVNMTQWLRRENRRTRSEVDLGPAKVVLTSELVPPEGRNEVVLITQPNSEELKYIIYNKDNSVRKQGKVKQTETVETGWMGMKFRLLRYLPHAKELVTYKVSPTASPISTSALKFKFHDAEYWLGLDSSLRLYLDDRMYLVGFGHRQLDLAFPLELRDFKVGKYEGTDRAATYESLVDVPGRGEVKISMNEPLQMQGFTFYQSSFEKNEKGEPVVSILSVNHDPGRWVKYLGSMMMVFGSIILFYFKRVQWIKKRSAK